MNNYFKNLQGGIFALVISKGKCKFYFSENSMFLIDDWESEILNEKYFVELSKYETPIEEIIVSINELKEQLTSDEVEKIIYWKMPRLIINFDNKELINNYYEQALENRIPGNWKGKFIEDKDEFLKLIPKEMTYWK